MRGLRGGKSGSFEDDVCDEIAEEWTGDGGGQLAWSGTWSKEHGVRSTRVEQAGAPAGMSLAPQHFAENSPAEPRARTGTH
ncbi:hypothetical protein CCHR01_15238 [Colletotrichum chrysophilum]|uniref:Uncharacterized protein n=1 Tax=Colletotrichum chrysophilum TaxID=1836956 RepID=A0AAD9A607_9PEZI|nr:hypothetical protein CCHR01_15238 [Colletotrichum chrysophilum]